MNLQKTTHGRSPRPEGLLALSLLLAARVAPRLGLVNTMVFSHLISNVLLICVALSPVAWMAIAFLLARHLLSQMDVPTRQTFLMLAVEDHEQRQMLLVQTQRGAEAVPDLLAALSGQRLGRVVVREPTLEDAYVRLVKGKA